MSLYLKKTNDTTAQFFRTYNSNLEQVEQTESDHVLPNITKSTSREQNLCLKNCENSILNSNLKHETIILNLKKDHEEVLNQKNFNIEELKAKDAQSQKEIAWLHESNLKLRSSLDRMKILLSERNEINSLPSNYEINVEEQSAQIHSNLKNQIITKRKEIELQSTDTKKQKNEHISQIFQRNRSFSINDYAWILQNEPKVMELNFPLKTSK